MDHSGRSQASEATISEGVEHGRRRIQKYYFPDFGVMLSQRRELGTVIIDNQTFFNICGSEHHAL